MSAEGPRELLYNSAANSTQNKLDSLLKKVCYIVIYYNDLVSKEIVLLWMYLFMCLSIIYF
jgi:hypothetical protein